MVVFLALGGPSRYWCDLVKFWLFRAGVKAQWPLPWDSRRRFLWPILMKGIVEALDCRATDWWPLVSCNETIFVVNAMVIVMMQEAAGIELGFEGSLPRPLAPTLLCLRETTMPLKANIEKVQHGQGALFGQSNRALLKLTS